ncbi:YbbR-like domain-containing protein [Polyangium fumosum]|uniref:YbbR-like domain-containing protein n=1 Tax=Polyangium fumosum TaxID=889272 RepID=A0A4U1JJL6_9BACT|nr:CdaR family protein [Polyangium fumosum]TKD12702.1 YbbR-like domain-containing protein [Polyangium fumosum]
MTAKDGLRENIRAALLDNIGLKILSLLCALGIYAFIHGAENAQRTFSVSVVTIMPPESANRQLMTQIPNEVKVTLRGSRTQLDDLRSDDLGTLQLNLRSGRETNLDLKPSMFRVPTGVQIEEVQPPSIELRWDDVVEREIPVQIARTGEPAPTFAVKGVIGSEPKVVRARGARSIVDVMQYARAAPFDVTGLTEGVYRRPLPLDKPPKLVNYDVVDSVIATVEIARELAKKEFANLRVEVVGLPRAVTTPPTVKVRLVGSNEDVNAVSPESLVPRVEPKSSGADVSKPGSVYLDVLLEVPHVKVVVDPPKVLVKW